MNQFIPIIADRLPTLIAVNGEDVFQQNQRLRVRLSKKGGKQHTMV